jgi:hypothetical protein
MRQTKDGASIAPALNARTAKPLTARMASGLMTLLASVYRKRSAARTNIMPSTLSGYFRYWGDELTPRRLA